MTKKYTSKLTFFFLILIFLCSTAWSAVQHVLTPYTEAIHQFEIFVKERMAQDRAPGLSIGFLKDDIIWTNGYGYSDLENRVPAKAESAYRLASITKTLTATAVLQLVEEGKIDLDAHVQTYVPYFPKKKWPVTVRLLLGHLGGISHYKNYAVEGRIKLHKDTKEALAIFQDWDLVAEPGTRYHYSSYGYNLLGAVIEGASGESYGDYIQQNIFRPLGMTNSRMDNPIDLIANRVRGYRLIDGKIKNSEYVDVSSRFAGGGTRSTVLDLLKYARGIIEGNLLKKETWDKVFTSMATKKGRFTGYGMGWSVRPWRGHFQVSHGGSQPETRTHLVIFPEENFAVAVGCNLEHINLIPYFSRLAELILDEDLDSTAYVTDDAGQLIYNTCEQVFSNGLSQFDWKGQAGDKTEKDLGQAFFDFNSYVNLEKLKTAFKETRKKIEDRFHPAGQEAFIKVGRHMASVLLGEKGDEVFTEYRKKGPLAFFGDYIRVSRQWPEDKKALTFSDSLVRLILGWEKEWNTVYTDDIRRLQISLKTEPKELKKRIKENFLTAKIYPDFFNSIKDAALYLLRTQETEKAFEFLHLGADLYAQNPDALVSLASAYIWTGEEEKAGELYKKAFAKQPTHPALSIRSFENFARSLQNAKKIDEIFLLAEIAVELRPKHAGLHEDIGDWYDRAGKKNKALQLYRKAFELNPKLKGIKDKIKKTEKEIKK
ncbi:MAG: serine hydrolase [Candidatus Aminicenantes bacterium]|jgi:CubicO group peptidase (beta-lactamase class C family)